MTFSHLASSPLAGPVHLRIDGVSRSFPDRRVLADVSFTVSSGERACLIGENGPGKSTLLRIVAGLDAPDAGSVTAPGSIGLFHQEPPFPRRLTVAEVLADAVAPVRILVCRIERAGQALADGHTTAEHAAAAEAFDIALNEAHQRHAWAIERECARLVEGLGLSTVLPQTRAAELSGGQLSRLSLAWVLLRRPEVLLLDEPTNHLDDRGAELVGQLLRSWAGPILLASHDRSFIDETATTLLDLDPRPVAHAVTRTDADSPGSGFGSTRFSGDYTAYLSHRREARRRWERLYRQEQEAIAGARAKVRADHRVGHAERAPRTEVRAAKKFYADRNARVVSRRVNDAATALERLQTDQVRKPPAEQSFAGLATSVRRDRQEQPPGPILVATEVAVQDRLPPTSLALNSRARLPVSGSNASGKSTLLLVLAGRVAATGGTVVTAGRLSLGLLGQESPERDAGWSVVETYRTAVGATIARDTPLAALGLIAGRDENRLLGDLNVGQRRRLDLAVVLARCPDVLLLDEPTNHLSLLLATELVESIDDYPGAVVIASHDRWLRRAWAGDQLRSP